MFWAQSKRRFERDCKEADRAQQYFEKMDADINVTKADVEKVRGRLRMPPRARHRALPAPRLPFLRSHKKAQGGSSLDGFSKMVSGELGRWVLPRWRGLAASKASSKGTHTGCRLPPPSRAGCVSGPPGPLQPCDVVAEGRTERLCLRWRQRLSSLEAPSLFIKAIDTARPLSLEQRLAFTQAGAGRWGFRSFLLPVGRAMCFYRLLLLLPDQLEMTLIEKRHELEFTQFCQILRFKMWYLARHSGTHP